ncbi:MAG TPA: BamA/TamA family outer membrane protein [Steroidobacteraceae bacterium]|nr:BamA/TamA family outer membrane protein [Steroidobacteraceae bacterium]
MSVSVPAAASSSSSAVNATAAGDAKKAKRGQFLAVPIPRVDPALGNGLIGVAAYIFKLDPADTVSPPSVVGAVAMWMDGGSVGGGLGGKLYIKEDRYRVTAGLLYADLRYDLGGTFAATGNDFKVPISQVANGGLASAQIRIAPSSYLGLSMKVGKLSTELRTDSPPGLPASIEDELGHVLQVNSLGPTYTYDTRDSTYYPRSGIALDAGIDYYAESLGSDVDVNRYEVNYRQYKTLRGRDVLAWQAYLCATGKDPPFFMQCQIGPMSLLRGYAYGVHRGDAMAAAQAEYRWQVRPRWILAAFAGIAEAAPKFGDFSLDETLYSGGVGVRYVVEPKNGVTLRVDYAQGKDEGTLYVSVGEAF